MEYVVFWILLSVVVAAAAHARGRSPLAWLVISLLISPIIALLLVLGMNPIAHRHDDARIPQPPAHIKPAWARDENTSVPAMPIFDMPIATKKCPDCAEEIKADARICRFCRHEFQSA